MMYALIVELRGLARDLRGRSGAAFRCGLGAARGGYLARQRGPSRVRRAAPCSSDCRSSGCRTAVPPSSC